MQIKDRAIIGVLLIAGFLGFNIYENYSRNQLTNVDVDSIISTAEQSFIEAESVVFKTKPVDPDDEPMGPNPDPDKCICKGTGKIVQGDGHVSDCPYHKKQEPVTAEHSCKCVTNDTYCNCESQFGTCSCNKNSTTVKTRRRIFPIFR